MNQNKKFFFDLNNFDAPGEVVEEIIEEEIEHVPPPPTFSEDDLEAAKAGAHAAGVREGATEEKNRREEKNTDLLEKIADNFSSLFAAEQYRERQYEEEAVRLALETLNIAVPTLTSRINNETLQSVIRQNLQKQAEQSEIIIELNSEDVADIEKMMETLWKDNDKAPRCKIIENAELSVGACSISWADGGLIRDPIKTAQAIRDELESLLTSDENNAINKDQEDSPSKSNGE